jgi:RNA polymerase sigma-70 factor (sigma-E family)
MYADQFEVRVTRGRGADAGSAAAWRPRLRRGPAVMTRVTGRREAAAAPSLAPAPLADQQADEFVSDLYQAHAVALVRLAKLLLRDQPSAEDVVQDVFIGLYRALPRLRDRDQVLPYLRTAVINRSRSVLRSRRRALLRRIPHEPPMSSAETAAMIGEDRREVLAAVSRLPRRAREVLVLRYYLDLPDHEIAAALGVSRGTVSSTASRALAVVARELKEEL